MTTCQACSTTKSTLWLCSNCQAKLRETLEALAFGMRQPNGTRSPGLLECLADHAIGKTKMGDGGRGSSRREPFKGDDEVLAPCACGHPEHEDRLCDAPLVETHPDLVGSLTLTTEIIGTCPCQDYRPVQDQDKIRAQFLAAGRVNARASELFDEIVNLLSTEIRELCESRGVVAPNLQTPARMALWLSRSVSAIASSDGAGESFSALYGLTGRIEHAIDRPVRRVWLGACPTWHEPTRRACGLILWAREDDIEVHCRRCGVNHACDRLKLLLFNDLEREKVPWANILRANKSQPEDRQVSERTLQSWRSTGRLPIRGYRRAANGREVINRHHPDDVPLYLWPDVRKLRDAKPQKKTTGAAARK